MKRVLSGTAMIFLVMAASVHAASCTGSASCKVCTNCSRCAYCKAGGSCGVCARTRPSAASPSVADTSLSNAAGGQTESPREAAKRRRKADCCTRVITADTIEVTKANGVQITVRLAGIAGPESRAPDEKMLALADGAAAYVTRSILDREVRLEEETNQRTDEHGRLLAYVFRVEDGRLLNKEILANGWAFTDAIYPCNRIAEFRTAEADAKRRSRGIWAAITGDDDAEKERGRRLKAANESRARGWLKIGDALRVKNPATASKWYEDIIRTYPDTVAADEARSRLADLKPK